MIFGMAVLVPLLAARVSATVFWTDDFENHLNDGTFGADSSGNLFVNVWDTGACNSQEPGPADGCNPGISTTSAHSGTHSLRSHYDALCGQGPTATGCGTYIYRNHPPTQDVWMRWWYRVDPGWQTNNATGSKQMYNKATGNFLMVWHEHPSSNELGAIAYTGASTPVYCASSNRIDTSCNYYANMVHVNINDAQFHCLETHANIGATGTSTGVIEVFVDGKQTMGYYNVPVAMEPGSWTEVTHYAQVGVGDRYIDDLAAGDARIGCGSTPTDTTPPAAPKGIKIM